MKHCTECNYQLDGYAEHETICGACLDQLETEKNMTTQTNPTFVGYNHEAGFWAFSPTKMNGMDIQFNLSHWSFEDINDFMSLPTDKERVLLLMRDEFNNIVIDRSDREL
jgi:hypothetical protein